MSPSPPSDAEIDARVREAIDIVPMLARQLKRQLGTRLEVAELEAGGRLGLVDAARTYDPSRGVPFRRWANLRIRGGMLDAVRTQGPLPRAVYRKLRALEAADRAMDGRLEDDAASPPGSAEAADKRIAETLGGMAMAMAAGFLGASSVGLDAIVDGEPTPEQLVADKEFGDALRRLVATRPEAERKLIERHYFDGVTFEVAAREIGLSKSWASRLHARAMAALAEEAQKLRESPGEK